MGLREHRLGNNLSGEHFAGGEILQLVAFGKATLAQELPLLVAPLAGRILNDIRDFLGGRRRVLGGGV